jgi:hypothetical protein
VLLVAAATLAELLELETASGRLFVLGGGVVALFALGALQCHDFSHLRILSDFECGHLLPLLEIPNSQLNPGVQFSVVSDRRC